MWFRCKIFLVFVYEIMDYVICILSTYFLYKVMKDIIVMYYESCKIKIELFIINKLLSVENYVKCIFFLLFFMIFRYI